MTDDDERLAKLIKRVRPRHDDGQAAPETKSERWRPLKRHDRRTITFTTARDGAQLPRET